MDTEILSLEVDGHVTSGVMTPCEGTPRALLVLGHGIANDREHFVIRGTLQSLAHRGVAGVRFNFPFKEEKRPDLDSAQVQFATFQAAIEAGQKRVGASVPLVTTAPVCQRVCHK